MSGSTPGAESALVKVATPSPSPLAKLDVDFTCTKFEMHPSLSEEERRFYMKMYPYVDLVNQRKVHCTVCKLHLGTAPASDSNIRMHPILRVTHCVKCHDFYNSGEFSKGEDGSELYCRWCGQGGEVYCCSTCPYVFCKSCIVKNLSKGVIVDIEQNEHWNCFSCTSKILWPLRAQHWALVNYIQTQKRALQSLQLPEVEARRHMLKDNSNCCRLAKSKTSSLSDSMESLESNVSKRSHASSVSSTKRGSMPKAGSSGPLAKRSKPSNDEVVCTPDLLSMLEPDCQLSVQQKPSGSRQPVPAANITTTPRIVTVQQNYQPSPSSSNSNGSASGSSAMSNPRNSLPPPLVLSGSGIRYRQPAPGAPNVVRRTVVPNSVKTTGPVFHTINGFRVDLNSAAQQDSYRLPNGRLIQVKRQMPQAGQPTPAPPPPPPTVSIPSGVVIRPRPPIPANRPAVHISNYGSNMGIYNPQTNQQQRAPHVRVGNANQVAPPLQGPPLNANGGQTLMITPAPLPTPPPKAPTLVRQSFPNTPMGQARAQLQEQIFSAMDICTHLTGKVLSLTHSNAYNQVRNFMELKELYIHMSYLMTYAIGRFKNLQEKCLVDMREKGFKNDANSLENGQLAAEKQASDDEDNEIEIVEPKTDTITIDSDNEDDTPSTSTQPPQQKAIMKITSVTSAAPKKEQREAHNQVDIDVAAFSSTILASLLEVDIGENTNRPKSVSPGQKKQPRKKTTNKPNPALLQLERQRMEDMKKFDAKLKKKVVIKLRRAEEEFEVARKWKEECRKQAQLAAERKNSVAEKDPSLEAEGQQSMEPEETSSLNAVEEKEPKDKEETESPNEQNAIKKVVEVDKEKIKSKEKIGDLLKAAIKAKIGETEKQLTEEKLTQEQSIKTKEAKTSEEQLASKEIEKEIEADNEITLTKDKKNEENKNASQNVLKKDEQVNSKESPSTSEMTEVSEKVSEKELSPPKEKVSKSDTAEMEVDLQTILDKKKTDQKEQKDVTEETTEKDLNPTIIADNEKKSPEKTSDAEISEIDELKEKEMETEISEDKEKPEESKDSAENCEKDSSMNSEKDSAEDTEEVAEKSVEEEKVIESEPLTDQENSNSAEAMETCDENGEPSVAELIESMDVTELVETPKELLDCGIDEDISMDGIELCAATEDLMNALDSPSVLTSENTNDDKTDLDSNALIEDLPLETSEPPEILLKEDESKMSSKSQRFPKESESSRENGDIAIETTQVSESAVDSSQTVG
ncbi:FK506-binding protein 5 isoform X1 [Drosophila ficusphila]|uniref:FK506-binding protein 5 isoform X1 n=1 Tax=Drosophila ficusphila TaxID=30025 RepID=UPI0007E873CC|nr:FK506-binding protein 5 isoform X1 [Drosophila ficusphila]XP_017049838.1 FK506-binding protein 5 isoform X1 [Drosophila ficusphila]XP_017049839.1 FK506-binding protein 5 isoform X1 [Drosophila ficusphila]